MTKFPSIRIITAMTPQRGIGFQGKLPWEACGVHLLDDMHHFQTLTRGGQHQRTGVIMGRSTWNSLPSAHRPLPHRTNYVLSTTHPTVSPLVHTMKNLYDCIDHGCATNHDTLWVIGGESVYAHVLEKNWVEDVWMTIVHGEFPFDRVFPSLPSSFKKIHSYTVFNSRVRYNTPTHKQTQPFALTFEQWQQKS